MAEINLLQDFTLLSKVEETHFEDCHHTMEFKTTETNFICTEVYLLVDKVYGQVKTTNGELNDEFDDETEYACTFQNLTMMF